MRLHYCDVCGKQVEVAGELTSVGWGLTGVRDACEGCMERIDSHRDGLVSKMHDNMATFVTELRGEHMRGDLPPARVP